MARPPFNQNPGFSGRVFPVTKANTNLTTGVTAALVCGTAGTVNLMDENGSTLTNFPLQAGYNPLRVIQVRTGGTADDIWALY